MILAPLSSPHTDSSGTKGKGGSQLRASPRPQPRIRGGGEGLPSLDRPRYSQDKPLAPSRGKAISPAQPTVSRQGASAPNGPCFPPEDASPRRHRGLLHAAPTSNGGHTGPIPHSSAGDPAAPWAPETPLPTQPLYHRSHRAAPTLKVTLPFHRPPCSWVGGWGGPRPPPDIQGPCCPSLLARPALPYHPVRSLCPSEPPAPCGLQGPQGLVAPITSPRSGLRPVLPRLPAQMASSRNGGWVPAALTPLLFSAHVEWDLPGRGTNCRPAPPTPAPHTALLPYLRQKFP